MLMNTPFPYYQERLILQLREINLPDDLKDEAFLIVGERRIH